MPIRIIFTMRYCHELLFDDLDNAARENLRGLLEYHARTCAGNDDAAWDWRWGDDWVVVRYQREDDAKLSIGTFEQHHDMFMDMCHVPSPLYRAQAIYAD